MTTLYGGNVETWRDWLSTENPVWSSRHGHAARRAPLSKLTTAHIHLTVIHLTSRSPETTVSAGAGPLMDTVPAECRHH
jgi:hypothetical protein